MSRLENKYLVPISRKEDLLNSIMHYLKYDYFSESRPEKEYTVRSIYIDTTALTSYYEKLAGIKIRNKFRIRGYNDLAQNSTVFMEIKRKENDYITKDRAPISYSELNDFFNHKDFSKILNHTAEYEKRLAAAKNFVFYMLRDKLNPMINVVYERIALECKFGSGLRVTFDMNIRSYLTQTYDDLFKTPDMENLYQSSFILEIKYNRVLPSWVPAIINKYNLKKEALSKYALSIDCHLRNKILIHPILTG